jgi:hypothetical protein
MNARSPSFGFSAHLSGKSAMNRWILPPDATIYAKGGIIPTQVSRSWRVRMDGDRS